MAAERVFHLGAPVAADPVTINIGTLALAPDLEPVAEERPVGPFPRSRGFPVETDPVVQGTPIAQEETQLLLGVNGGQMRSERKARDMTSVPVHFILHKVKALLPVPNPISQAAGKDRRGTGWTGQAILSRQCNYGEKQCCYDHSDPDGDLFVFNALEAKTWGQTSWKRHSRQTHGTKSTPSSLQLLYSPHGCLQHLYIQPQSTGVGGHSGVQAQVRGCIPVLSSASRDF